MLVCARVDPCMIGTGSNVSLCKCMAARYRGMQVMQQAGCSAQRALAAGIGEGEE